MKIFGRMLAVVVLVAALATVSQVSAVGTVTGYWQLPDDKGVGGAGQALTESIRSILVSEGKMIFGAGDIGANGGLPSGDSFGIASYDGTTWSSISGSGVEAQGTCNTYSGRPSVQVVAGTASDLYVAGEFTHINGVSATLIARRTGGTWSALGQGLCSIDTAGDYWQMGDILVDGSNVYVTGSFRTHSGSESYVNGIAMWNGSSWSALGGGMTASSYPKYGRAIEKDPVNGVIYVGGAFDSVNASYTSASGVFGGPVSDTTGIACWNPTTSTWSSIGASLSASNEVNAMVYSNGALYVGGDFSSIGGVTSPFVAKFTPTGACSGTWSALGGGLTSSVIGSGSTELCSTDVSDNTGVWSMIEDSIGTIYVGCNPDDTDNPAVLKWTGSVWTTFSQSRVGTNGAGRSVGRTRALAMFADRIWASGSYYNNQNNSSGLVRFSAVIDVTAPTVSSFASAQSSPTSEASFTYTLNFSETVTGATSGDFSNAGSATGCTFNPGSDSGSTRTVTVSGCGPGTVIPVFAVSGASDTSGNLGPATAATASTTITVVDVTPPTASWTVPGSSNSRTLSYTLAFSESVSGVTSGDFSNVATSGAATGCSFTPSAASGTSVTVSVVCTSDGAVTVRLAASSVSDSSSNAGPTANSDASIITIDSAASAIGVPNLDAASDSGVSSIDDITSDSTPTFTVDVTALEAGATGRVKATKTGSSDVTCTLSSGSCTLGTLGAGTWSIVSYQTDAAGNVSADSSALSVVIDTTAPTTATLASSAATSTSATITFTVTGNEQLDCTSLSSTAGTDFTLTAGISAISSIAQTSNTLCTIAATSTAIVGGGAVTSTLTAAVSFSVSDPAGNALTTLTGSPQSITVTVPDNTTVTTPATTTPATTTTIATTTTVAPRTTTPTTAPTQPRVLIPGVVAPKKVTVLTPVPKNDPTVVVADLVRQLAADGDTQAANKIRSAVISAAPAIGEAIADATEQLVKVLEDKSSTKLEIIKAKAAVADAAAQTILTALKATNGNIQSLALPVTNKSSLPEVEPGEALIITPTGTKPAQTRVVDDSTVVMTSKQENLSLAMSAVNSDGDLAGVNAKGAVQATPGQSLAVTGSGFKPNSKVAVWMFSSPRSFGFVTTDANGSFAAEVPMPDNIPPGDHTAQINGQRANGDTRSLNLGLEVGLEEAPSTATNKTPSTAASKISGRIQFDFQSAVLTTVAQKQLTRIAQRLQEIPGISVECFGYTQFGVKRGRDILAQNRASAVCQQLRKLGVKAKFNAIGVGRAKVSTAAARHVQLKIRYATSTAK